MRFLSSFVRIGVACLLVLGLSAKLAQAQAICDQQARFTRPIQLGISGGNIKSFQRVKKKFVCFGGTLGSLVEDSAGQYIMSNNHVLGRTNRAKRGEGIVQPGLIDTECTKILGNRVATFSRSVKLTFKRTAENTIDAAVAQIAAGQVAPDIRNIGAISSTTVGATLGLEVQKMGRTTCLTSAQISAVAVNATVGYDDFNPAIKRANFVNQIKIDGNGFAGAGDSGSLIVTTGGCPQAVGLLFAGSSDGSTLANPINNVLSGLGVTLVGTCGGGASTAPSPALMESQAIGIAPDAVASATAVRDKHSAELMQIPGAVGTGIGIGDHPGQPAIEVYVTKVTPEAQAAAPTSLNGLTVRLVETKGFVAY